MILFVDFESVRPPDCIVNIDLRYTLFGFFQLPCWISVVRFVHCNFINLIVG